MNFTNTDRQNSKMFWSIVSYMGMRWQVDGQAYEDVIVQVKWMLKDQIYPIQTKIEQEMKK